MDTMKSETQNHHLSTCALAIVAGSLLLAGCSTPAKRPTQYPFSAKDWNGMDSVEFVQELKAEEFSRLVVQPLDTAATKLPPPEENTYAPAMRMIKLTDSILLTEIAGKAPALQVSDQLPDAASVDKTLLLRGRIDEMNPGSRAARYWVGFGAGSAWVKISGSISDAKSGQELLRFEQRRVGAIGFFGGDYDAMLKDCVVEIGRDVGHMLTCLRTP